MSFFVFFVPLFVPFVLIPVFAFVFAGCTVGPDFRRPDAPAAKTYTESAMPETTVSAPVKDGDAQRFVSGGEISAQWWTLFHSESLDLLIRRALDNSPTLAAAQAALLESEENVRAKIGSALYPHVDAGLSAERQKVSNAGFGQPGGASFNLYNASVNVSYAFDFFGGARRELESLISQVDYQRFLLEAAYLTLTSNIVTTSVKEASLRALIDVTRNILSTREKELGVVEERFRLGGVSLSDVLAARTLLAQTSATLPPLEKELSQTRHLLAILTGRLPGEAGLPEFNLDGLRLPQELPVSLPSELVRQRPDVRAYEALLHAASAQVGVATALMYPQISISGSLGSETNKLGDLIGANTSIWGIGTGLVQPLFHGGELTAKRRGAVAAYSQAEAQYRDTVLHAFQNVADVLRALDEDAKLLKAQADAESTARDTLDITRKQFKVGAVSYLSLLVAERQYQQTRLSLVQAGEARLIDTAALFQALGGGWWNRQQQADYGTDYGALEKKIF
ncbi:MAG: efflux transporter outer membrane subunit [Nitrospirae bacterium]|nr:efflux transporter outer membrane subunit [Nitrospirota bacterium]